ncbi:MAG: chemotaxis protein CheC [Clostridia bacterium]|jgi:chemotaxis protein CheC|nr:chemotaxis protein CheC [Clostridia bacterium]
MNSWNHITGFQLEVLREIGNIGAGNAASSLATLLNKKVEMAVPKAGVMDFKEIFSLVGNEEEIVACINFNVSGKAPGKILFLLDESSTYQLVDMLLGRGIGTTKELDEIGQSTVKEIGNILTGSFITAFSEFTRLDFIGSVPAFAFDMLGAVLSAAFLEGGYFDERVLIIETTFYEEEVSINGHFFFVPATGSMETIFEALGLNV